MGWTVKFEPSSHPLDTSVPDAPQGILEKIATGNEKGRARVTVEFYMDLSPSDYPDEVQKSPNGMAQYEADLLKEEPGYVIEHLTNREDAKITVTTAPQMAGRS